VAARHSQPSQKKDEEIRFWEETNAQKRYEQTQESLGLASGFRRLKNASLSATVNIEKQTAKRAVLKKIDFTEEPVETDYKGRAWTNLVRLRMNQTSTPTKISGGT